MKKVVVFLFAALTGTNLMAKTLHVDLNSTNSIAPYDSRETAATDIQTAVNAAVSGDTVLVWDGHYLLSSEITVSKAITVQSANGPETTIVDGQGTVRCFNLGNSVCVLEGLTITNGYDSVGGGGIFCSGRIPMVANCILSGNSAEWGGGMYYGTANNCTISGNSASEYGGGMYYGTANNCTISGNSANYGGGMVEGTANNCTITGNSASEDGGGMYGGMVNNCTLSGNSAAKRGGGMYYGTANNCIISGNSANSGGGIYYGTAKNCIVYFNTSPTGNDLYDTTASYSCSPDVTHGVDGNITNAPMLVSSSHIADDSPCRGAGSVEYNTGTDIDGEAWANPPSMGCDEPSDDLLRGPIAVDFVVNESMVASGYPIRFWEQIHGGLSKHVWDFGDGTRVANSPSVEHAWASPGTFEVVLTAYNADWPGGVSATQEVSILSIEESAIHVSPDGNDSNDGTSWASAKKTIQAGVDAQNFLGGGVLVGSGSYSLTNEIVVDKQVRIIGVDGPDSTKVDGQGQVRCFNLGDSACVVEGLTITNGYSSGSGGGIYCSGASILTNCTITGNSAFQYGGGMYYGTVNNCTITGNSAGSGGGMRGGTANNCTITGNSAAQNGGGMLYGTVNNCILSGNSAGMGGGISGVVANNCTISGNSAGYSGGGVNYGTLNNCTIIGNTAEVGGGTYDGTANNCTISDNTATEEGGGMRGGAANNCTISGNSAEYGGGMRGGTANNCTISGNSAEYGGGMSFCTANNCILSGNAAFFYGGGMEYCTANSCTISGNSASNYGGGMGRGTAKNCIVYGNSAPQGNNLYSATVYFSCSPDAAHGVDGNITNAPVFVDALNGDYRLAAGSPCIDAGSNGFVVGALDLAGNPRIVNGIVDMGAYEFQMASGTDADSDRMDDFWEQEYFGGLDRDGAGDYDADGLLDLAEYISGTDPTDVASSFTATVGGPDSGGFVADWTSVEGRTYSVFWSPALDTDFELLQDGIEYPQNSYTDTVHSAESAGFYQIGVRLK
ncbi:MAG: PKD domain-containing protein [Lentisphaerae bacterium]|nr:PKD domain-containing protein [Lentisphaerota bacterium]